MKRTLFIFAAAINLTVAQAHAVGDPLFYNNDENKSIVVHNRILAKVNGKAISVYDVMKKMDMMFYRAFPEYTSSTVARFQFYQLQWKRMLQELIDKELIMADAEESKMTVSAGDVRQDMEQLFGPNIHANLDKVGLTFEEAWKMVHSDIVIKRMLYVRAHLKAMKHVTPQTTKAAYDVFAKENIRPDMWTYQVLTIRELDKAKGAEAAHQVYTLLSEDHVPFQDLPSEAKKLASVAASTKISVSEEFSHAEKDMSAMYKDILSGLTNGAFSRPIPQKSRADNSTVYRIFYLKEMRPGGAIPFSEVANKIKEKQLEEASTRESDAYIRKLRKHFAVQESHLEDAASGEFEPFQLL